MQGGQSGGMRVYIRGSGSAERASRDPSAEEVPSLVGQSFVECASSFSSPSVYNLCVPRLSAALSASVGAVDVFLLK